VKKINALVATGNNAVPWLRRLVTSSNGADPGYVCVSPCAICDGQISTGTCCLRVCFFPVNTIPPGLNIPISSGRWRPDPSVAAVQRHGLTPLIWTTTTMGKELKIILRASLQVISGQMWPGSPVCPRCIKLW
jgi:hypothetical protein